jgi:hypothetical protein
MGYSLDGQANVTTTANGTLSSLLDGSHNVVVYANNTAGNMSASSQVHFTVNTALPNITSIVQSPIASNVQPLTAVNVNATVTSTATITQVTLNYTTDGGTWTPLAMTNLQGNIWNGTISGQGTGTSITYVIVAEDNESRTVNSQDLGYTLHYTVIPEFSPLFLVPVFILAAVLGVMIKRRKTAPRTT